MGLVFLILENDMWNRFRRQSIREAFRSIIECHAIKDLFFAHRIRIFDRFYSGYYFQAISLQTRPSREEYFAQKVNAQRSKSFL